MILPCLLTAAHAYSVSPTRLERIVQTTRDLRARRLPTGVGITGIQAGWLPILASAGFQPKDLKQDNCTNLRAAAWILRESENRAIANRHLQQVPSYLVRYAEQASAVTGVPKTVLLAVAWQESGFHPNAVSPKGAEGLMQFMPGTWPRFGTGSPFDPQAALLAGARYLRELYSKFHNWDLVFAAYNAGSGAVVKYGYHIPPYQQTEAYVPGVISHYWQLKGHLETVANQAQAPHIIESTPPSSH